MKIVAIGGGEIGRPKAEGGKYPIETLEIDKEIVRLSGKAHPKLLFLPTASGDSGGYVKVVEDYYGKKLGCNVDSLLLLKEKYSSDELRKKILGADIIYVGGGNTLRMLKLWRRRGVDKLLEEAGNNGTVLSGISAGAICWFQYSNSDSMRFGPSKSFKMIRLKGLNLVPLMACPHYDVEASRRPTLTKMVSQRGGKVIALENCTAFEYVDGQYRILSSKPSANAHYLSRINGKVVEEKLPKDQRFRPLEELFVR